MKAEGRKRTAERIFFRKLHSVGLAVLLSALLLGGAPLKARAEGDGSPAVKDTLKIFRQEWGEDKSLKGLFDSASFYFQAGNWDVEEAALELRLSASGLLNREVSYLTITLDGQAVETIPIPENGGETAVYTAALPAEKFAEAGGHTVRVEAYLRGQTTDACADDSSVSTWLNFFGDSAVELRYTPRPMENTIASFYEKFVSIEALEEQKSIVSAGAGAPASALTALARICAGFAQNAEGDYERVSYRTVEKKEDLEADSYVLYVDRLERLPDFLAEAMAPEQKRLAEESAVVCLTECGEAKLLLVTGSNDAALVKAGDLLSNPELIPGLVRESRQIDPAGDYTTEPNEWEEYIPLSGSGELLKGSFEQSADFFVYCPVNRRLAESAQLSLDYRYSANLDFDKSLLTVYINGVPVGSRALTVQGTDASTAVFDIPGDVDAVGSFTVEIRFALYPKGDGWCELTPEEIPWAYVADSSMLKWTTKENTAVFFEYYPFPFIRDGAFSGTKLVLPESWEEEDAAVMTGILLTMGGWLKGNSGGLDVLCASEKETFSGSHVIFIGSAGRNLRGTEDLELSDGRGCALLELEEGEGALRAKMTVTGGDGAGMRGILEVLGRSTELWRAAGDLIYMEGGRLSQHYIRQPEPEPPQPALKSPPERAEQSTPLIVVCSLLALALLAAAMLLIKYGKGGSRKNERE